MSSLSPTKFERFIDINKSDLKNPFIQRSKKDYKPSQNSQNQKVPQDNHFKKS